MSLKSNRPLVFKITLEVGGTTHQTRALWIVLHFDYYHLSYSLFQLHQIHCTNFNPPSPAQILKKGPNLNDLNKTVGCSNPMKYASTQKLENFEFEMNMQRALSHVGHVRLLTIVGVAWNVSNKHLLQYHIDNMHDSLHFWYKHWLKDTKSKPTLFVSFIFHMCLIHAPVMLLQCHN